MNRLTAASDDSALRFERLQTNFAEGPCLAAYSTNAAVEIPDLAKDSRFPRFAERALHEGLVAVFAFPLRDGDRGLGALDLYRESAGPLSSAEMAAAQTLADVAAAYLLNAQARVDLKAVSAAEGDALERLRVIDRTKTEFMATVMHELRTPMTSISGYVELLQDGSAGELSPTQHKVLDAIGRNVARLTTLVNDLLTLARLEQGAVLSEHSSVNLGDAVLAAAATLQELIASRRLEVAIDVPRAPVMVDGDARHLERLVSNLLTNAVKYTEDGGWVRCTLRSDGGQAQLEVSDNGIGVPEDEQADLFTRFFRSSLAEETSIGGSGLGLNIVETIAHNHGGKVSFTSAAGRGSTFTVDLPLRDRSAG